MLNANGMSEYGKRQQILHFLRTADVDIVAIQEPHAKDLDAEFWSSSWPGKALWSHYTAFLVKPNMSISLIFQSQDTRILGVHVAKGKMSLDIANLYIPSEQEARKDFLEHMPFLGERYQVVVGDFNLYPQALDHSQRKLRPKREWNSIEQKLSPLTDSIRFLHPHEHIFTHRQKNSSNGLTRTRIDHIFLHPELLDVQKQASYNFCPFSDHCLVTSSLVWGENPRFQRGIRDDIMVNPLLQPRHRFKEDQKI